MLNILNLQHYWLVFTYSVCGAKSQSVKVVISIVTSLILFAILYSNFASEQHVSATLHSAADTAVLNLDSGFKHHKLSQFEEENFPNEWVRHREYAVVIDSGSSGSRALIYSWKNPEYLRKFDTSGKTLDSLPIIEPGDENGLDWQFKEKPGISTFAENPDQVDKHLKPLLDFAVSKVPARKRHQTPVYLLATAGLRLVSSDQRAKILEKVCLFVREHYDFAIDGGCDKHFRVISGELEGIYGWLAVNYLKGGFDSKFSTTTDLHTFGFLDLGGASTQIAFEPTNEMARRHGNDLTSLKLRTISGEDVLFKVFVTTYLGYGVNEARRRYIEMLLAKSSAETTGVEDPCLPSGLSPHSHNFEHNSELVGAGNFKSCLDEIYPLLNKSLICDDDPCTFNGVHVPLEDFKKHRFLGISEYYYTPNDIFDLAGNYSYHKFKDATLAFCNRPWSETVDRFNKGEYPRVNKLKRLELQCFKSTYIMSVLHAGYGIPTDMENYKKSSFESLESIGQFSVSWTLGAALLHASATIPPKQHFYSLGTLSLDKVSAHVMLTVLIIGVLFMYWMWSRFVFVNKARKRRMSGRSPAVENNYYYDAEMERMLNSNTPNNGISNNGNLNSQSSPSLFGGQDHYDQATIELVGITVDGDSSVRKPQAFAMSRELSSGGTYSSIDRVLSSETTMRRSQSSSPSPRKKWTDASGSSGAKSGPSNL